MRRLSIALLTTIALTLTPVFQHYARSHRQPPDYDLLVEKLNRVSLCPDTWESRQTDFRFDSQLRQRLKLRHYRSIDLTSPAGTHLVVLLMLSDVGEQLYHTPDVCYAAQGCEVGEEVVPIEFGSAGGSTLRAVKIVFHEVATPTTRVAAYGFWSDNRWVSPPPSRVLNQLGHERYLLKIQILVEGPSPHDERLREFCDRYLEFLSSQLVRLDL